MSIKNRFYNNNYLIIDYINDNFNSNNINIYTVVYNGIQNAYMV